MTQNTIKRVVITGATSFIGGHFVRYLLEQNCEIYAIIRPQSKNAAILPCSNLIHLIQANMSDMTAWVPLISSADVFIHMGWDGIGAEGRADASIQDKNVADSLRCIEGARLLGCRRFLFCGSQAEYGPHAGIISEVTPCAPVLEYGKGKLRVLKQALHMASSEMLYLHARIFSVYGENDHPWALVPNCIRAFCKNDMIKLSSCEQMWNFLHIDDAVKALWALLSTANAGQHTIYNIASNDTRPLREFVEQIRALSGGGIALYGQRENLLERPIGIQPDISRLQQITGWLPQVSFEEGIRALIIQERGR